MELFIIVFAALFSVINPLGTLPIFVGLTQENSQTERSRISLFTSINVLVILVISFFIGRYILHFFGISIESLRIAGGLIIATSGFALLTGSFSKHKGMEKQRVKDDAFQREAVSLTPLAIPMLAGPGSISLLIGLYEEYDLFSQKIVVVSAIVAVCIATFLMLRCSHYIVRFLGASGINAISRIIGFIVIAIGVEYISSSVISILKLA
ncbi:MarC family NAAT transporter [Salinimicrobium sp. TH3]|uniref:MarC family NAAT transporter n=1 Tax=Salinimicrobium sp. TH3 TaxID=2997342 RepID=UPI002275C99F|nr:MarC family NAAT transporter [Salinimicrobium sp. TH3]MCY2686207.1 MarC family NAAT transporter [Salinimicrobium sp. TH3]